MGDNWKSRYYQEKIRREKLWGLISEAAKNGDEEFSELLIDDYTSMTYIVFNELSRRHYEGKLVALGVNRSQIWLYGGMEYLSAGGKVRNIVNPIVGYTWKGNNGDGWIVFEDTNKADKENVISIVTIGGSTSDATFENLRSWSEILFDLLKSRGFDVRIYAGGICGYTVSQEFLKMITDIMVIKPDIVISYSGVNEAGTHSYNCPDAPFIREYIVDYLRTAVSKEELKSFGGELIKGVSNGLPCQSSKAEFWINTQRMMKSICEEFHIKFIGILQPYYHEIQYLWGRQEEIDEKSLFYKCVRNEISQYPYLFDFSHIFDRKEDQFFFDGSHVYEQGNIKIARKILSILLNVVKLGY